jgi:hypothetical protein
MYATFRKRSQVHSVSDSTPAQEPTWGRYIPDDPSTLYASDQLYRSFNYDNYEKSKLDSYYYDKEQPKFETGLFKSESFHFNLPEIHSDNTFDQSFTYRMERSSNTHHDTSLELHREHIKHSY